MIRGRRTRRGRAWVWALLLAGLVCASPPDAAAQGGRRGGRRPLPGGRPGKDDPTDPARQQAAVERRAARELEAGRKLLAKGRIQQAKVKFKSVIGLVGAEGGAGQAAFSALRGIHQQGMDSLKKAATLYEQGQYRKAFELAKQTKAIYANILGGVPGAAGAPNISRLAVGLIKQIEADPKAHIAFQEYEASKRARRIPRLEKQAKKNPDRYFDLYKLLKKIAERYPDCPTAKQCVARLAKLKTDKKIWKRIRREESRRFIATVLNRVERYERDGLPAKAAAEYKKLTRKYPGKTRAQLRKMSEKR